MEKQIRVATVGDNCIDFYDSTGEYYPGGNPVNVAVYMTRMGAHASYTGAVGQDGYGRFMIESIKAKGVDTSHIKILPGSTALTHVLLQEGERILGEYEEGVMADFKLSAEDIAFLCSHDLIVSGIWGKIDPDLPELKKRGVPLAFDFADKLDHNITRRALPYVDYAFFSWEGEDMQELMAFMKRTQALGPGIVVVTRGAKGSIAYDGESFTEFGIIACDVIDSMGAGDSYIAGFLLGMLTHKSIAESMKQGALSSSITLGYYGAW